MTILQSSSHEVEIRLLSNEGEHTVVLARQT